jgi:K+ transporter
MPLVETIRAYLGWCPMTGSIRRDLAVRPATTAAAGGRDCVLRTEPGWWKRHHNQLLVAAIAFSAAAAALFILFEDASGHLAMWTGLAVGVGALLGSLLSYRSRYARVAAGEFFRDNMTRRQRIVQYLRVPVASVLLAAGMAYFVLGGMFDRILGIVLGMCLICWTWYGLTILWERQHRTIMIAEWGSVYTLDTATEGERV